MYINDIISVNKHKMPRLITQLFSVSTIVLLFMINFAFPLPNNFKRIQ